MHPKAMCVLQDIARQQCAKPGAEAGKDTGSACKADPKRAKPMLGHDQPLTPSKHVMSEAHVGGKRQVCPGLCSPVLVSSEISFKDLYMLRGPTRLSHQSSMFMAEPA